MNEPRDDRAGDLVGSRYRILSPIGVGGMASVYRADDELLGRVVAVKIMSAAPDDNVSAERERAEIRLLAAVSHPALITLFDAGVTSIDGEERTFLVMEFVEGPNLGTRIEAGPIPWADGWKMAADIAEALSVVHARGIIHRDIKPANILLGPSPIPGFEFSAKLADFGIAHLADSTRLTQTGMLIGTAAYLSPEQARGGELGAPSDIYSLGLVLLEALTRTREFPGTMVEAVSARLVRDPTIPGSVDAEWRSLLLSMTAREPTSRPTATEVAAQARAVLAARSLAGEAVAPIVDGSDEGLAPTRVLETTPTVLMPRADVAEAAVQRRRARRVAPIVALVLVAAAVLTTAAVLGGTEFNQLIHPSTVPTTPAVGSSLVPTPVVTFTPIPTQTVPSPPPPKHGPGHGKDKHHG